MMWHKLREIITPHPLLVLALNESEQGPGGLISVVVNVNVMEVVL